MTNKSQQHMNDTSRKEISEILVKWSMPTRQVAISEIVTLFTQHQERVIERLEEEKVDIRPEIKVWLTHQSREEATVHNQTLDKAISIIREESIYEEDNNIIIW